jgi:hypothetical protein
MQVSRFLLALMLNVSVIPVQTFGRPQQQEGPQTPMAERIIRHPDFVPASQAGFLESRDRIVGVAANGIAKAYWAPMAVWHHLIEDRLGETRVLVTWCSLCGTCLVFRPDVNGQVLTFDIEGLRGMNLVLQDRETHSQWQQATGEAFAGPLKGKHLPMVSFLFTSWQAWRTLHPDTLALVPKPQDRDNYERMEIFMRSSPFETPLIERPLHEDARIPAHEAVAGIGVGGGHKAYAIEDLRASPMVNGQVGTEPVLVIYTASDDMVTAFSRKLGRQILTFKSSGSDKLTDEQSGSIWTPQGECVAGALKGKKLEAITPQPSFWFGWAEFHPDTKVFQPQ